MSTSSWTPCKSSSPGYVMIFLRFAALRVPTNASKRLAHLSSRNRTPNFTLNFPSASNLKKHNISQCKNLFFATMYGQSTRFFLIKKFYYTWFTMFYQFLLYSKVTQLYINIHSFTHIIIYQILPQAIGNSSLCYTAGPHCLSILDVIVCIY